jgi:hypothetical protein
VHNSGAEKYNLISTHNLVLLSFEPYGCTYQGVEMSEMKWVRHLAHTGETEMHTTAVEKYKGNKAYF